MVTASSENTPAIPARTRHKRTGVITVDKDMAFGGTNMDPQAVEYLLLEGEKSEFDKS
jgi:hypothetical protein